ncbi:uncharacterized protein LOC134297956 [Anolis carolinensis]|uniref:uncharacterized protein LOC134297956 n=1 Tax=Anolis carolinensis TaxID=28377 RepID=UPI002F2B3646
MEKTIRTPEVRVGPGRPRGLLPGQPEALGLCRGVQEALGLAVGVQEEAWGRGVQEGGPQRKPGSGDREARAGPEWGCFGAEQGAGPPSWWLPGAENPQEGSEERPLLAEGGEARPRLPVAGQVEWAGERRAGSGFGVQEEAGQIGGSERCGVEEEHPPEEENEKEEEEGKWGAFSLWGEEEESGVLLIEEEEGQGVSAVGQERGLALGGRQEQAGFGEIGLGVAEQEVGLWAQQQPHGEAEARFWGRPLPERALWPRRWRWGGQEAVRHSALQERAGGPGRGSQQEEGGLRQAVQEGQPLELGGFGWGVQEGGRGHREATVAAGLNRGKRPSREPKEANPIIHRRGYLNLPSA